MFRIQRLMTVSTAAVRRVRRSRRRSGRRRMMGSMAVLWMWMRMRRVDVRVMAAIGRRRSRRMRNGTVA